jgi:hypothetical protein
MERGELLNKTLLVVGLTLIRLPRTFGLDGNPWVLIIILVPFWFVIINNHLPEIKIPPGVPKYVSRILLQILLLFNIAGFLIVISAVFVKAFTEQASTGYLVLTIIILILIMTISIYGILTLIRGAYFEQRILIVGLLYFLVSLVGIFRASVQTPFLLLNIYQIITVLIFGLSAKKTLNSKPQLFMRYVFTGLVFYLGANVLFHLVGMENQTEIYLKKFDSVMLSLIGIETSRVYYPLAEGINPFGMVGGAGFVMSVAMGITMIKNRSKDIISWIMITLGVSFSFYIILTTDTRGAILFAFLTVGLTQPAVLIARENLLRNFTFLLPMIRSNSDVLSGRGVIWQAGIEQLSTFNWIHLIGYGLSGQTVSGVVDKYNHLFVSYIYTNRVSLHHFGLQTIYDFGYLGLLLAYSLMFLMGITLIRRIRAYPDNQEAFLAFAFLLYIILAGSVSTIPAFYARELFVIFIFVWVATGMNPRENYAS